jgi:hypothetical protein
VSCIGHSSRGRELADSANVHRAPDAPRFSRGEANRVAVGIAPAPDRVDPAERQGLIEGFLIGDALLSRAFLIEAQQYLRLGTMLALEPRAEVGA